MKNQLPNHIVYSAAVIEFTAVVAETCRFLENLAETTKADFVSKALKILPLLYLKTAILEVPAPETDELPEHFVTEDDYQFVRENLAQLLGNEDVYLETLTPEIQFSDTPVATFVSENLADVYQEIRDYAEVYQSGIEAVMNDSLVLCLETFGEHWGQKLLNALRALHSIRYGETFEQNEEKNEDIEQNLFNKNDFFDYQHD
jgi:hypothetical protein